MNSRKLCTIAAYIFILGGVIHSSLSFVFFNEFSMRVMWFVSQGLMGIFLGFLNLVVLRVKQLDNYTFWVTNLANILALLFVAFYLQVDKDPQGYMLAGVLILMTVGAWTSNHKSVNA